MNGLEGRVTKIKNTQFIRRVCFLLDELVLEIGRTVRFIYATRIFCHHSLTAATRCCIESYPDDTRNYTETLQLIDCNRLRDVVKIEVVLPGTTEKT